MAADFRIWRALGVRRWRWNPADDGARSPACVRWRASRNGTVAACGGKRGRGRMSSVASS